MRDWARHVRPRLSSLRLSPSRENEIVEELSQHLDDRWRELMAGGTPHDEATRLALAEFREGNLLGAGTWLRCGRRRRRRPSRQALRPDTSSPTSGRTCGMGRARCGSSQPSPWPRFSRWHSASAPTRRCSRLSTRSCCSRSHTPIPSRCSWSTHELTTSVGAERLPRPPARRTLVRRARRVHRDRVHADRPRRTGIRHGTELSPPSCSRYSTCRRSPAIRFVRTKTREVAIRSCSGATGSGSAATPATSESWGRRLPQTASRPQWLTSMPAALDFPQELIDSGCRSPSAQHGGHGQPRHALSAGRRPSARRHSVERRPQAGCEWPHRLEQATRREHRFDDAPDVTPRRDRGEHAHCAAARPQRRRVRADDCASPT